MHYLKIIPLFVLLILISCTPEQQDVETVSMDDLMGETTTTIFNENDTLTTQPEVQIDFAKSIADLIQNLAPNYAASELNKPHAFDRYGFTTKAKAKILLKSDQKNKSESNTELFVYTFSDSTKLNNAFYNLLDCFGDNCSEIKVREDLELIKTTPSTTLVYDTVYVYINHEQNYTKKDWNNLLKNITNKYGSSYRYKIDITKKGKLSWN